MGCPAHVFDRCSTPRQVVMIGAVVSRQMRCSGRGTPATQHFSSSLTYFNASKDASSRAMV